MFSIALAWWVMLAAQQAPAAPTGPAGGSTPVGSAAAAAAAAPGSAHPGGASGSEGAPGDPGTPADAAAAPGPRSCLEEELAEGPKRKGVQRRDFIKKHRVELSPVGGLYASDALSSTYAWGGALSFFIAEDFGLEALVTRSPVEFRLEEPYTGFDREKHFAPGAAWQGIGSFLYSPWHAKFKLTDATIVHGDLFVALGAGRTDHDSVQGLTYAAGVGLKLYLARFLSFRVDVRDFMLPQEVLSRGRVTHNVGLLAGLGVWSP